MASILSVSHDLSLLETRQKLLESCGHSVVSCADKKQAIDQCESDARFDLFVVGHSIPHEDKEELIAAFRAKRPTTPVIALKRMGEQFVHGADVLIEPEPRLVVESVRALVRDEGTAA